MNHVDDQQLVKAARTGEVSAFAALIGRHYPLLLASCRRMLGDPEAAADAAQEATLRALRDSLHDTYKECIDMTEQTPQLIPMHVAQVRRAPRQSSGLERHVVFLEDEQGRRLPIWIGPAEATAMALVLEQVDLPRPGVYQFAASLLTGAGTRLREVRISALSDSIFYAQAILEDDMSVDARPSDALTLALVTGAPIYVEPSVLAQAELTATTRQALIDEANAATEDSRTIVEEVIAARTAISAALREPGR